MTQDFLLSLRLLKRDWQAGELRILILALVIAVASTTLIQFFADRLHRGMVDKAADIMGGDLVISSPQPIPQAWLDHAATAGLRNLKTLEFRTVALHGEAMQLGSVKAVGDAYPLRGLVRTADQPFVDGEPAVRGPAPGTIWVEARVLSALQANVGDKLLIGDAELQVSRVLTYESDRGGSFYSFSPRIMMSLQDIDATGVIQPGSRVTWRLVLAGDAAAIKAFQQWVEPQLSAHHQLQDVTNNRPELSNALVKAEDYLGLTSLMAVLLAGVAIAMAANRYSLRHFDLSAILRSLGMSQSRIVWIYLWQFLAIATLGSALGCVIGWGGHFVLEILLRATLPVALPPPGWMPVVTGTGTAFIILTGFALPPVLRLRKVPPLRVLRRDLLPPAPTVLSLYVLAMAAMVLLMWQHTGNAQLTFTVAFGLLAVLALFGVLALLVLRAVQALRHVDLAWRIGIRRLGRNQTASVGQLLAFSLTLMAMLLLVLVRTDLLRNWQAQLPDNAPNHFAINVQTGDKQAFTDFLDAQGIARAEVYPMVRGRITHINDAPVQDKVDAEVRKSDEFNRELNLTWSATLAPDNKLLEGQWWPASANDAASTSETNIETSTETNTQPKGSVAHPAQVSLEARFASRLGVRVGDTLRLSLAGAPLYATIASIRQVQWDSFKPNFFVMFEPGALEGMAATYMTSFYLAPQQKHQLNALMARFPSVTVLEVDAILRQVKEILVQVTLAVEYMLLFALLAGVVVLWAAVQTTLTERLQEGALLRALGAGRSMLKRAQRVEFLGLGALAGLLAASGAEVVLFALHTQVFHLEFAPNLWAWLIMPVTGMLLVGAAGLTGARRVVEEPPQTVLREL